MRLSRVDSRRRARARKRLAAEGRRCWLCGGEGFWVVPNGRGANHYLALTVHHVVPRCQGGGWERWNIVAAHRRCNMRQGERLPGLMLLVVKSGWDRRGRAA